MIQRRDDLGMVSVKGVGMFALGTLQVSINPRGGIDLFDEVSNRYLLMRQKPERFGAASDAEALTLVQSATALRPAFSGYGGIPPGSFTDAVRHLADTKEDRFDEDLVALFDSALEE